MVDFQIGVDLGGTKTEAVALDGEGRIVLPQNLVDHAGIDESATFVGRGRTFQIWQPGKFEDFQGQARERARDQGLTLRLRPGQDGDR